MGTRKTILITGASRGIGHATAQYFVRQGWRAITLSRDPVPPQCPRNERHAHITLDLSEPSRLPEAIEQFYAVLDGEELHALVNNAGYSPKSEHGGRLGCLDSDLSIWQQVFAINFFAPVYFCRTLAPLLERGRGSIVNITSIAGHRVHPFAGSAYSTSKAALSALTRELTADLAHLGHPRERRMSWRDQHRHPLPRHGRAGRADPDAPPRLARRGGRRHPLSRERSGLLHHGCGDPGERRPGRLLSERS